jgi:GNAT superfamily N-acetyltransferase
MDIATFSPDQFAEFRELVDREIQPAGAQTRAWEDNPLGLGPANRRMARGICRDGRVAAGISCLVRQFRTDCGAIPIAAVGSVVTRPEYRDQGLSRALQQDLLENLGQADVPLAVLWTDQPAAYRGRGFVPAGWEFHVDLDQTDLATTLPTGFSCRDFLPADVAAIEGIYRRHPFRTERLPGDSALLYGMPGTHGLVAAGTAAQPVAAVFCGKGADFPGYVLEWGGPVGLVLPLVAEAHRRGWARHLLAPPGGEHLAHRLAGAGATVTARESGLWRVVQPDKLARYLQKAGRGSLTDPAAPKLVLGSVDDQGVVVPGVLTVAVWGFDSV